MWYNVQRLHWSTVFTKIRTINEKNGWHDRQEIMSRSVLPSFISLSNLNCFKCSVITRYSDQRTENIYNDNVRFKRRTGSHHRLYASLTAPNSQFAAYSLWLWIHIDIVLLCVLSSTGPGSSDGRRRECEHDQRHLGWETILQVLILVSMHYVVQLFAVYWPRHWCR